MATHEHINILQRINELTTLDDTPLELINELTRWVGSFISAPHRRTILEFNQACENSPNLLRLLPLLQFPTGTLEALRDFLFDAFNRVFLVETSSVNSGEKFFLQWKPEERASHIPKFQHLGKLISFSLNLLDTQNIEWKTQLCNELLLIVESGLLGSRNPGKRPAMKRQHRVAALLALSYYHPNFSDDSQKTLF